MTTLSIGQESRSKPDLKTELFVAVSEAFPESASVTVTALATGHPKISGRKLPPQYLVRVTGLIADTYEVRTVVVKEDGKEIPRVEHKPVKAPYAVGGMYPQDGSVQGVKAFVDELKADAGRIAESFPK